MLDLNEMRASAEEFLREAGRGYETVPMRVVVAHLATPMLQLIEAMESKKTDRWLTLDEVMSRTGWNRKYFDKPLVSLGGISRLEKWAANGQAEQTSSGLWLISPAQVPPPRPGYEPPESEGTQVPDRTAPMVPRAGAALDPQAIADQLLA
jgi:hypothetical protein